MQRREEGYAAVSDELGAVSAHMCGIALTVLFTSFLFSVKCRRAGRELTENGFILSRMKTLAEEPIRSLSPGLIKYPCNLRYSFLGFHKAFEHLGDLSHVE